MFLYINSIKWEYFKKEYGRKIMNNKNSKSNSYIVREAELVIENYLKNREKGNIESYQILKQKYERLKILAIAIFFTSTLGILLNLLHIY